MVQGAINYLLFISLFFLYKNLHVTKHLTTFFYCFQALIFGSCLITGFCCCFCCCCCCNFCFGKFKPNAPEDQTNYTNLHVSIEIIWSDILIAICMWQFRISNNKQVYFVWLWALKSILYNKKKKYFCI